ncbi:unnamed protein product [Vitrella brassicaformis CCMP3155]|uniref:Sugar phosphate transporter domain-containing protein n=2 Tax=Vitrella brassicaformis TaxID=1169539 RepID=A0A0G4GAJ5_VITBC|nr:unnamed protein product [Vitrella brassicaformis CCMP3155]|eukprot:CEM26000.1 unnamed protein product [Vitrella brassicaformis CCMP3155]
MAETASSTCPSDTQSTPSSPAPDGKTPCSAEDDTHTRTSNDTPPSPPFSTAFAVSSYCACSIGLVWLNRLLFTEMVPLPLFLSWVQQVIGLMLSVVLGSWTCHTSCPVSVKGFFRPIEWRWEDGRRVLPLAVLFVGMLAFNNICLRYVQVAVYQVARSTSILFNLLLSSLLLKSDPLSMEALSACLVALLGLLIATFDPDTLSVFGALTGSLGSLFGAFYMVGVKHVGGQVSFAHQNGAECQLMAYVNSYALVLFPPLIWLSGEYDQLVDQVFSGDAGVPRQWVLCVLVMVSGLMGVGISFTTFLCLRVVSPVTCVVIGYVKSCVQTIGGVAVFSETLTAKGWLGTLVCLAGSFWYSYASYKEKRGKTHKSSCSAAEQQEGDGSIREEGKKEQ